MRLSTTVTSISASSLLTGLTAADLEHIKHENQAAPIIVPTSRTDTIAMSEEFSPSVIIQYQFSTGRESVHYVISPSELLL